MKDESGTPPSGFTRRELLRATGIGAAAGLLLPLGAGPARAAEPGLPQVPRRRLGKTGRTVPILLMGGGMRFDQRFDPKLAEALRFGVNYFDTADCYAGGTSETGIGNFLERTGKRPDVWITTKSDKWDPRGMVETLEVSLKKLKTDHVDLFFFHQLNDGKALTPQVAETAERLKKEGRIKGFGFSCHDGNVAELLTQAAGLPWIDAIMFRYNFRQYGNKELNAAIDAAAKADIGLMAMKTQGSESGIADAWRKFEQTGKWNKFQSVLKAVWADPRISAAVSHMDSLEKLKENVAAAVDRHELGAAEHGSLLRYAAATRGLACDGCDHLCNPAVDAPVRIGATLRFLMYHDAYGDREEALRRFRELPAEAQRLEGVDFAPARRACPHGVDVVAQMERARRLFCG
ncbi:MAG TPA: aldo/keto reductase [Anaeromyxobacteraceae bacterium]|nr:aldo/keto reductase [Anaeromyxobacteraceae bacterium]